MRVYIPATLPMLQRLVADGEFAPMNGTAFALTPRLREAYIAGDEEELEYVAMAEAALASLRLLAMELDADPKAEPRRAVVAADLDAVTPRPDLDDGAVRLAGPVPMAAIAAIHLDTVEAGAAVRAAAAAVDAADLGDPEAEFVIGEAQDHDLAWYVPSELPFLLELL